jgi:hypothetical protein
MLQWRVKRDNPFVWRFTVSVHISNFMLGRQNLMRGVFLAIQKMVRSLQYFYTEQLPHLIGFGRVDHR